MYANPSHRTPEANDELCGAVGEKVRQLPGVLPPRRILLQIGPAGIVASRCCLLELRSLRLAEPFEHASLIFGGRGQCLFRLLLLACPPRGLDGAAKLNVALLKEIMTREGLGAADSHEG